ncbi:MAG: type I pantothenate kinase [Chitinophagaceae bacterium]|nr:MAG: type I pantothenate kinase [Chitinophagaceae bacterium]
MKQGAANYTPYLHFSRAEWAKLKDDQLLHVLGNEIDSLRALNEPLTEEEIVQIYLPLSRLLTFYIAASQELYAVTDKFLHASIIKVPFIIGIAGSVAVGKSTTARVLKRLLSLWPGHPKVELVTTDGFLYSNKILDQRNLLERKGFPESYDARKLIRFLADLKSGKPKVLAPVYSHLYYDVVQEDHWIAQPDIVIIEGINVLQAGRPTDKTFRVFVSDFFDFSIYVDAAADHIERWYVERFETLKKTAFRDPASYFHRFANLSTEESVAMAKKIWSEINKPNLTENILPTRNRAKLILKKGPDHFVEEVWLRKL